MAEIQPIRSEHFEALYQKFLKDDDVRITRDHWKRLFEEYSNRGDADNFGYMLIHESNIVGMLGMVHSQREIDGQSQRFCNLHSWFVDPEFRGYSMLLMRPILRLQDCTITDLTPTPAVRKISARLGFKPLDSNVQILLPRLQVFRRNDELATAWNQQIESIKLTSSQQLIHQDQSQLGCDCLLASNGNDQCFMVIRRVEIHWRPYCYVLFISNPRFFAEYHSSIRKQILRHVGGSFVALDNRLLCGERLPRSIKLPVRTEQIFRSNSVSSEKIDSLYTEVAILGLTTFPSVRSIAGRIKHRLSVGDQTE